MPESVSESQERHERLLSANKRLADRHITGDHEWGPKGPKSPAGAGYEQGPQGR